MAQTTVNVRMDQALKEDFEEVCAGMGIAMSSAFKIFAKRVTRDRAIPFEINAPFPPGFPVFTTMEDLREKLEIGLADIEAGRVIPAEKVFEDIRTKHGF